MRSGRAPGRPNITDHITLSNRGTFCHRELRHVQVHRFEALAVIDADCPSVQVPVADDLHDAAVDRVDRRAGGRPLIDPAVEIPVGLPLIQRCTPKGDVMQPRTGSANGSDQ